MFKLILFFFSFLMIKHSGGIVFFFFYFFSPQRNCYSACITLKHEICKVKFLHIHLCINLFFIMFVYLYRHTRDEIKKIIHILIDWIFMSKFLSKQEEFFLSSSSLIKFLDLFVKSIFLWITVHYNKKYEHAIETWPISL